MEVAIAAWLPALVAVASTWSRRMSDDLRRAIRFWFVPLALLWLAPSWLRGGTPGAFDLLGLVWPWRALAHGAPAGNPLLNDFVFQFAPWRAALLRAAASGAWPFLDRTAACGAALWANPQTAVLHPLTWLGAFFSPAALPLFAGEAKLLLAAAGSYVFLRNDGRSHVAALFGAVAYTFSIFTIAFLFAPQTMVTVMLPWLLVAVQRCRTPLTLGSSAACAFAFFLAAAGGHPESLFHSLLVVLAFCIREWLIAGRSLSFAIRTGSVVLAGMFLAAPQLLPFVSVIGDSERVAQIAADPAIVHAPALTWANLAGFVAPALLKDRIAAFWGDNFNEVATQYAGLLTLALALIAARRQRFWAAMFVAAALLAFYIAPISAIASRIPLFGLTLHGRLRFVLAFITAVLAADGLDLLQKRWHLRWPQAAALLVAADLFLVMFNFYPPVEPGWAYPRTGALAFLEAHARPGRIATVGVTLPPNSATMYGLQDIGAHDPLTWEPYGRLLATAGYDRRGYFATFHAIPSRPLLDFLGVRFVVLPPDAGPASAAYRGADAVVLANPSALPRFFIPTGFDSTADPIESWRRSADARFVHLGQNVQISLASATLRFESGANGSVVFVSALSETFIVASEPAMPGWTLACDGVAHPLVAVNGIFLGWRVPRGDHRFTLDYRPPHLRDGLLLALLAPLLIAGARSDRLRLP